MAARVTRRGLLTGALGVALATPARAQPAPPLVSQQAARYQPFPKNGLFCGACTFFRSPAACQLVAGRISPHGWCRFFDMTD